MNIKSKDEVRSKKYVLRLNENEYNELMIKSNDANMKASEFIRMLIREHIPNNLDYIDDGYENPEDYDYYSD